MKITTAFTEEEKEKRKEKYKQFYNSKGINLNKLLKKYETGKNKNDGYVCICEFCTQSFICNPYGKKECCISGEPCNDFDPDLDAIAEES